LISFIASIAALILSYFVLELQNKFFVSEMIYLGLNDLFKFFSIGESIGFIVFTTFVGATVSYFCIQKLNTGWSQATGQTREW
jgi:hypothetical protein